ncbi:MAG: hypothetical protein E7022_06465 [Desulfovibrio desulfuricans]|nr:hypothetical protein [Desulfovibrio desulfuricans]
MPFRTFSPVASPSRGSRSDGFTPVSGSSRAADTAWPGAEPLFPPLTDEARALLERLPEALRAVRPLKAAHRRSLPEDVAALSRLLTTERAGLVKPYWGSPAAVSAYLYYFLPWNLVRLTRLLAALPLPDPFEAAGEGGEALLLDVGSGPLTLPLALWLTRPRWRSAPVRVLALDASPQPLQLGRALMETLGKLTGLPVWPVRTARAPLEQAVRQAAPLLAGGARLWLASAANVLNESRGGSRRRGGGMEDMPVDDAALADEGEFTPEGDEGREAEQGCADARLDSLLASFAPLFARGGSGQDALPLPVLLFVEPGTRLGGSTIMRLRRLATEGGLTALAPCTHQEPCPLRRGRTWCHFTFDSEGAPAWLTQLSAEAGLGKSGLSLSPLLLSPAPPLPAPQGGRSSGGSTWARIVSSPLAVPGLRGAARYACCGQGLLLLENAAGATCGDRVPVTLPPKGGRDRKSGARIVRQRVPGSDGSRHGGRQAQHAPGRDGQERPSAVAERRRGKGRQRGSAGAGDAAATSVAGKKPRQPKGRTVGSGKGRQRGDD